MIPLLTVSPLETIISNGLTSVVNNNLVLAIFMLAFFFIFLLLQGTRLDAKVAIMVPAGFLAIYFDPIFVFPVAFGVAFLFWKALMRGDQG